MTDSPILPGSDAARALFPITGQTIYMNHASASPLSTRVAGAMRSWVDWWQQNGARMPMPHPEDAGRSTLARLIGARPDEVAIVPNTSEGLLLVAQGFPWQSGDRLLTVEEEFTANVYPWLPLREQGVEIVRLPTHQHRVRLEEVEAALRAEPRIRLLTISFVAFSSGFRADLAALGQLCRQYDVRLCVDAIQGLGAIPIDVNGMGIDFLSAGGQKWLMGPVGAGLFYVRHSLIEMLRPGHHGWLSTTEYDFFRYDLPWADSASRFEAGTHPWPSLIGLVASAETLLEVGIPRIERHLLELGEALIEGLEARGYGVITPRAPHERSGIVSFHPRQGDAESLHATLERSGITLSARGDLVRVSPHFYNTRDEIETLLSHL